MRSLRAQEICPPILCGVVYLVYFGIFMVYFPGRVSLEDYREVLEQPFVVLKPQNPFWVLVVKRRSFA